jgi:hypothetical protein
VLAGVNPRLLPLGKKPPIEDSQPKKALSEQPSPLF